MIRVRLLQAKLASLALALLAARVEAQALPSSYDLRTVTTGSGVQAWVPAIQNQGIFNDCWTFASATAIESNLLKNGYLSPQLMPPPATISSWHISTRNGAPESLVSTGTYGNSTTDYGWGGFEYQTMGYLTRGQGAWAIPDVPSPSSNFITTMGGGPVTVSGTVNAFPHVLVNNSPANIGYLLPAADQTPAWLTRQVTFLDQGFGGNVALPAPLEPGKNKYLFNQGAADPQVQAVKNAILAGGAVTTSMNGDWNYFSFTSGTGGLYTVSYVNPGQDPYHTDHEVTIIGWSDSQAVGSGTGAWLVQNSWGTSGWTTSDNPHPNDGTFWASYDDPSIGRTGVASFSMAPTTGYAPTVLQNELGPIGYAYDFNATSSVLGLAADQHTAFSSVLTPTTSGALAGLGVINGIVGTSLEYSILSGWSAANPSGGTVLASGSLTLGGVGYQLIDLATPVALTANQSIAVLLTYGTAGAAGVVVGGDGLYGVTQVSGSFSYPVNPGLSYYYDTNAATWTDFATKTYTASASTSSADTTGGVLFLKGVMVAAVPEPSTLALAAAGLGAALCTLLRRRGRLLGCAGLVVAVLAFTPAASAQQPVAIPLELQGNRLVIYVGVDNQPPYPYMFDSGSQIFEASQAALAGATLSGTLATGLVQQYSDSGFLYDAVTVSSLQFYASGSAPTPVASLAATGTGGGYRMGSITASYSGTYSGTSTPVTPVTSTTCVGPYSGIFGAGSFTSLASGSIVMGSVLGQATTTGWVVSANGPQPTLSLGLDATLRGYFTSGTNSALYDWIPGGAAFPGSGAASSQQNLVTMNLAVESGTTTIQWSTPTLFDTGNETNGLKPSAATVADLETAGATFTTGSTYYLSPGVGLTVTGTAGAFSYVPSVPFMFPVQAETSGTATSAFGIDFFRANSVLYDLENQQVGFTTAAVPEPSTLALAAAGLGAALCTLLRRRGKARRSVAAFPGPFLAAAALLGGREAVAQSGYTSPFSITLDPNIAVWTDDFASRQRHIYANTTPAQNAWYAPSTTYASPSYGPLNPQLYSTSSSSIGSPAGAAALQYDRGQPVYDVPLNSPPAGVSTTTWQQQRILAAANTLLTAPNGTAYQHLHLPTFDPALVTGGTGFPWSPVSTGTVLQSSLQLASGTTGTTPNPYAAEYGKPAPGIDCTDFSAYVYSLALGVQMHSGVSSQVQFTGSSGKPAPGATAFATVLDTTGTPLEPQFFYGPNFGTDVLNTGTGTGPLASLIDQFQPGDLLYMGDPDLGILHVVMWLGQTGTDSAGNVFPLVISSHDNTPAIFDTLALDPTTGFPSDGNIAGHLPPPGVHILPFDQSNWFYQDFQLAMRVVAVPEPSTYCMALAGLACCGYWIRARGSCRWPCPSRPLPRCSRQGSPPAVS